MKEKIINYIETLEAKAYQSDDYFKQRNELYIENQKKNKEIENLVKLSNANYQSFIEVNNIINKAIKYIKNNEKEYGSLEDNEKIILDILKGEDKE